MLLVNVGYRLHGIVASPLPDLDFLPTSFVVACWPVIYCSDMTVMVNESSHVGAGNLHNTMRMMRPREPGTKEIRRKSRLAL